jgi:Lon protease-like protein
MSERVLPLFPLQVVLFPGSLLPLHIFEERYKVLVRECIAGGSEFGINLVYEKELQKIGCTAIIANVVRRYDDGRMDIVVQGRRPYRVLHEKVSDKPYLEGLVHFLVRVEEEIDRGLAAETVEMYNELVSRVYRNQVQLIKTEKYELGLSFVLAQKAGMDLMQRQHLLESSSENERLRMLHNYLGSVIPKLEKIEEVERIVKSDGYL